MNKIIVLIILFFQNTLCFSQNIYTDIQGKDVNDFINDYKINPFRIIIKPVNSAGSDSVFLCENIEDLERRFNEIIGTRNKLNIINNRVLIQEYLVGDEYIIDTVSLDGNHKVAAVWKYDKRKYKESNFVYYGQVPVNTNEEYYEEMLNYVFNVLDILNIKNGAGHSEIILTLRGPYLVETGARCQGSEGTFMELANIIWGYNQVEMFVSSLIKKENFEKYYKVPINNTLYGYKLDLISNKVGILKKINDKEKVRIMRLQSFVKFDILPKIGQNMQITCDLFTNVGSVTLVHKNKKQLYLDIIKLRKYEKNMFIV